MSVKANQPQFLQDIKGLLAQVNKGQAHPFRPTCVQAVGEARPQRVQDAQSLGLAHGRVERRTLRLLALSPSQRQLWPGAEQVFAIERCITHKKSGKTSCEVVCGVTSLPPDQANAATLLELVRAHWGIENRSHWIRDVLWQEDQGRAHTGHLPQVLATFRNLALPLLRRIHPTNLAHAARKCAANPQLAFNLLARTE